LVWCGRHGGPCLGAGQSGRMEAPRQPLPPAILILTGMAEEASPGGPASSPDLFSDRSGQESDPPCAHGRTPTIGWKSRSESSWLSVVEGNCVIERWGGKQPEANIQSANKTMLNPIQSESPASLWRKGEAREVSSLSEKGGGRRHQSTAFAASARQGGFGMCGGRMDGSWCDVKWGSQPGTGAEFMTTRSEEPRPRGDRALVVAKKRVMTVERRGAGRRKP